MVNNMLFLPTSLILIGYSFLMLLYTTKNRESKIQAHVLTNELLIASLFLLAGILFPFMYSFHSPNLSPRSLNYLWLFTSTLFLIEMFIWIILLSYNANLSKKNPDIMAARDYDKFCTDFSEKWVDDIRSEFGRKILHLIAPIIIFTFWITGIILNDTGILIQWGLDIYSFSFIISDLTIFFSI